MQEGGVGVVHDHIWCLMHAILPPPQAKDEVKDSEWCLPLKFGHQS